MAGHPMDRGSVDLLEAHHGERREAESAQEMGPGLLDLPIGARRPEAKITRSRIRRPFARRTTGEGMHLARRCLPNPHPPNVTDTVQFEQGNLLGSLQVRKAFHFLEHGLGVSARSTLGRGHGQCIGKA